jgi:integrase
MSEKTQHVAGCASTATARNHCDAVTEASKLAALRINPEEHAEAQSLTRPTLITVSETALLLRVSESWVRRHLVELPVIRCGRLLRIDAEELNRKIEFGKSLKSERVNMTPRRYQRGSVFLDRNVWKGMFRLDTPSDKRKQKKVTLGTRKELPNKTDAREKLAEIMKEMMKSGSPPSTKAKKFSELVEDWKKTEGVTLGRSTLTHYSNTLRACVLPTFGERDIPTIDRNSIQLFLAEQAKNYSLSYLRSMRITLCMVLGWAEKSGLIQQPHGWLQGIRLPRETHGRTVTRMELKPEITLRIIARMQEPYATLALCLASVGCRGEEAVGLQPDDLDANDILHIRRVIYGGQVESLKKEQHLQLDPVVHASLIQRMRTLGTGAKWIFHSRAGTPINLGNARRRHLHPATRACGVKIGGWHDFRHSVVRAMRRANVNPVVISGVVGHKSVELAPEVYDRASSDDMGQALSLVGKRLLPPMLPGESAQ